MLNRFAAPLAARAACYQQLGLLLESGFDLSHALRVLTTQSATTAPARDWQGIARTQRSGLSLGAAIRASQPGWAAFDLALIDAGERSGRLAACCTLLGRHYTQQASLLRRVLADATYPLVLLHALIVLRPIPALFSGGSLGHYLAGSLGVLLAIYLGLGLLRRLLQAAHGQVWRGRVERVLGAVPVLGDALRTLALARLAAALEALISAGIGLDEAWRQAGMASGSSALATATARFAPALARGLSSASALADSKAFPLEFVSQYHAAEAAGRLDHCLRGLAVRYTTEGFQSLRNFCRAVPKILLLLIALLVGFQIARAWLAHLPAGD